MAAVYRVRWLRWVLPCVLSMGGCSRASTSHEPAAEPAAPPAPRPAAEASAPRSAVALALGRHRVFDLVATSDGALLAWGAPGPCERALRLSPLDAEGTPREAVVVDACASSVALSAALQPIAQGLSEVTELVLGAAGGKLGVAWVLESAHAARILGTHGDDRALGLAPVSALSATVPRSSAPSGRLSMAAAETGQLFIAYRTPPGPCNAHEGPTCAHYVARAHPQLAASPGRGVEQREVPDACDHMLAGTLVRDGTWYDAVCTRKQDPLTTVFVIQPEISYAEALEVLPGCVPLGLAPASRGAVLLGSCDDGLAAWTLSADGRGDRRLRRIERSVRCRGGRPLVTLIGTEGDPVELQLGAPISRLELLLPPNVAPAGARAAFTGEALLVARADGGELTLERYGCVASHLERLEP